MNKISKKNQDPHQIKQDQAGIEKILSKRSQHFTPGTAILRNGKRGTILMEFDDLRTGENLLWVEWDSGKRELIAPLALNRRNNG